MITNNYSKIIKNFIDLIYSEQIRNFNIFIDHERKGGKGRTKNTIRSIENMAESRFMKNYI